MRRVQTAMEIKMQMIMAILSLALLMLVDEASAQKTYSVSVSRHASLKEPLSEKEVRNILKDASAMLQKNSEGNGDADVACNVTFSLKGPVRTFGSPGTSTDIVDEQHRDAVHKIDSDVAGVDFHVKVVKEIMFCRPGLHGPFDGCSFPIDFRSIIVVDPSEHKDALPNHVKYPDHLLWAHEFGHLTGLPHRHSKVALMTSCPVVGLFSVTNVQVDKEECRCLLGGPGFCPPPPMLNCQPQ
jgi:hypothetical protein